MSIDAKRLFERLKPKEPARGPISIYLDKELWKAFQDACGDISASKALEELMRELVASVNGSDAGSTPHRELIDSINSMDKNDAEALKEVAKGMITKRAGTKGKKAAD